MTRQNAEGHETAQQSHSTPPQPGQLVEVRRRLWVATDVDGPSLQNGNGRHDLVTLSSLEEDALGEELQVIWQVEPGALVHENAGLPKINGFDPQDKLQAFLNAVKWGTGTNADRLFLQSPFRSGISIEEYQLDPLVRAIDMARVRMLIADDVGLGKTIETGLVLQELLIRHRIRTIIIVCPASLQIKWQNEMREKFGLEFKIVDTGYVKWMRRNRGIHANPWTSFPHLITSMDWMKQGEGLRLIRDCLPPSITYPRKFDMLVVDEAHNVAPSTVSTYAVESLRTRLIRTIAPHFEHRLFLSATPHNGYKESFTALLELLDDQRFARSAEPNEAQLKRAMVRRMKSDLVDRDGKPIFPERKLHVLRIEYTDDEKMAHRLLESYTSSRNREVSDSEHRRGSKFIHKLLKKRMFSSPRAFADTLEVHMDTLAGRRRTDRSPIVGSRILARRIMRTEEDFADEAMAESAVKEALEAVGDISHSLSHQEETYLHELRAWASVAKNREDSKAKAVLEWLTSHLKTDGNWNGKRVIFFTEFKATLAWLEQILVSKGYGGERLGIIHGDIDPKEREAIMAAFQAHPDVSPIRILLATDAASEGIDLQNHCNYLIHLEIPWNPNKLEQRNGRIDRHGQKEPVVHIWHPVGADSEDEEFLLRAVMKLENIREDLGAVGPVIANQIVEAMLGERKQLDTSMAEKRAEGVRKVLAREKELNQRIARLAERLDQVKSDYGLTAENIALAVETGLSLADKPPIVPTRVHDAPPNSCFKVPYLDGSWGRAAVGLNHPHTRVRRPITFDNDVARGRDDVVLSHLNHPLVRMCLRLLREELWKMDDIKKLHRVGIRMIEDSKLDDPVVFVWSRLLITGGDHNRLHEEIHYSGGHLKESGFARIPQVGKLDELIDASEAAKSPSQEDLKLLGIRFENNSAAVQNAVEARSRERLGNLENTLERRKESEVKDLTSVLEELKKTIKSELEESALPKKVKLPGMGENERDQIRKDIAALTARLERIPDEIARETEAIERHYSDPKDHTFPVAIEFIVPKKLLN